MGYKSGHVLEQSEGLKRERECISIDVDVEDIPSVNIGEVSMKMKHSHEDPPKGEDYKQLENKQY